MMSTASSSMSLRTSAAGHGSPVTCSFGASPVPTPRLNLHPVSRPAGAAARAMVAGLEPRGRGGCRGGDRQAGDLRDRPDHGPAEARVPLLIEPGAEVIGDPQ